MGYAVKLVRTINVDANTVWATISAGDGLDKWMPAITECRVEGSGAGATRYCTMADGAKLTERLLEVNHDRRRFKCGIDEHPLPAKNIVGAVDILDLGKGKSEVSWSAGFDCDASHREELTGMFKSVYEQGLEGLEAYLRTRPAKT
jgi:uncharacterized protein YndB with AHSA1/START domain